MLRNLFAIGIEAKQSTTLIPLSTKRNSPLPGARKREEYKKASMSSSAKITPRAARQCVN